MVAQTFIDELHCPYCGSSLHVALQLPPGSLEIEYGILECDCHRYPIVDGILVMRRLESTILDFLDNADTDGAFRAALYELTPEDTRTRRRHVVDFLQRIRSPFAGALAGHDAARLSHKSHSRAMSTFRRALHDLRPGTYGDYLFHRYANPSFLSSIGLLPSLGALERRRVLDLGCGTAHATFVSRQVFPDLSAVAADHDFINLYLARRFIVPDAAHVCIDLEAPLPFSDDAFDAVFCLDAFHYVRSKRALVRELDRVVERQGIWLFAHLHNALVFNLSPGMPLSPKGYLRCFDGVQPRLFAEADILNALVLEPEIDLRNSPSDVTLQGSNALCMACSRREDVWRSYENVTAHLCSDRSLLAINPIYQGTYDGPTAHLQMIWPNARLRTECVGLNAYIPEAHEVDRSLLDRVESESTTAEDVPEIQKLAKLFVLVPLPPHYGRTA